MFKKIFTKKSVDKKEELPTNWKVLDSFDKLEAIISESKNEVVGIFKHSTRCIVSKTVLKQFSATVSENIPIIFYYLDLLEYRDISNKIAEHLEVVHQSPQLLIIRDEKVILEASHYDIVKIDLQNIIN